VGTGLGAFGYERDTAGGGLVAPVHERIIPDNIGTQRGTTELTAATGG
jgi:hypothetical protein